MPDSSGPLVVPSRIPKMSFGVSSTLHSQTLPLPEIHDHVAIISRTSTLTSFRRA